MAVRATLMVRLGLVRVRLEQSYQIVYALRIHAVQTLASMEEPVLHVMELIVVHAQGVTSEIIVKLNDVDVEVSYAWRVAL